MAEYVDYIITVAPSDKIRDLIRCCRSFEPIVRCRDCKRYGKGRRCSWSCRHVEPDGFCKWGERRE